MSIANDSILSRNDLFNNDMEQPENKFTKKVWVDTKPNVLPNVLDPDDSLMKKFQNALREHLTRVDKKLSDEILELVSLFLYLLSNLYNTKTRYNCYIIYI